MSELRRADGAFPTSSPRQSTEHDEILRVLKETNGRVAGPNGAATRMGIKRTTLISRMKKLGMIHECPNRREVATIWSRNPHVYRHLTVSTP